MPSSSSSLLPPSVLPMPLPPPNPSLDLASFLLRSPSGAGDSSSAAGVASADIAGDDSDNPFSPLLETLLPDHSSSLPNPNPNLLFPFIDPTPHVSSQFYTFTAASHSLMLRCLLDRRAATASEIRAATSPSVLASWRAVWRDRNEDTAYLTAWKRIQDKLAAAGEHIYFKSNAGLRVSHVGQWRDIVASAHADPDLLRHLSVKDTIDRIKQSWTVGAKLYGIPEPFIKACVAACPLCASGGVPLSGMEPSIAVSPGRGKRRRRFEYTETIDVPAKDVPRRLQQLAAKHKVVLCIRQKYIRYKPFMAEVKDYACHRAGVPTSVATAASSDGKKMKVLKREPYQSKRCGCGFRIRAIVPIDNYNEKDKTFVYKEEGTAVFKLYAIHSGHEPGPLDGNARIVHRLVGHKGTFEFDPDVYGVEEEGEAGFMVKSDVGSSSHNVVVQQVQELKSEVALLDEKVSKFPHDIMSSVSSELSEILLRIRNLGVDRQDDCTYQQDALLVGHEDVEAWGAEVDHHQHLEQQDSAFCKDHEIMEEDTDFAVSLGPLVPWDRMAEECHDRKMLIGESPKCNKWMMKIAVGDFERSILNCGDDDDDESDAKLIKPLTHDVGIITEPNFVSMHVDGFYSGTKWYDSPGGLDSGGDSVDAGFRHG